MHCVKIANKRNKMNSILYMILSISIFVSDLSFGQSRDTLQTYSIQGLSLMSGMTYCAVKDEFISDEKYSGSSVSYLVRWSKQHQSYLYDLRMEVLSGVDVKNNSVSAKVTDFNLSITYAYPIGNINIFGKKIDLFFGPYPELYFHYRSQNIASGGLALLDAHSAAFLFSLGGRAFAYMPLNENIFLSGELSSNILSLGGKFIDPKDNSNSMIKLLTVFSGMRLSSQYAINYRFSDLFSSSIGYRFNFTKINAWDLLVFSSDNLFLSLTISL